MVLLAVVHLGNGSRSRVETWFVVLEPIKFNPDWAIDVTCLVSGPNGFCISRMNLLSANKFKFIFVYLNQQIFTIY